MIDLHEENLSCFAFRSSWGPFLCYFVIILTHIDMCVTFFLHITYGIPGFYAIHLHTSGSHK
jgi:hypothetical protein